jgi:hypothetical protein
MNNFEIDTVELLKSLPINRKQLDNLMAALEWEKEVSWCNGYADAVDHYEYGVVNLVGQA